MIKHPSLRVHSFGDLDKGVVAELYADFRWAVEPLPFTVHDFQGVGSGAEGRWSFHSDFDLNLETDNKDEALRLWRENPQAARECSRRFKSLWPKWGSRVVFSFEATTMADFPEISYFSFKEGKHYRPEKTVRVDYRNGVAIPRIPKPVIAPQKYGFGFGRLDEDGIVHPGEDDYTADEIEHWAAIYDSKFLRVGETEDTKHIKGYVPRPAS